MQYTGTNKSEPLTGTTAADVFIASGGNDVLDGRGGSDFVSYAEWNGPVTVTLGMFGTDGSAAKYLRQNIAGNWYTFYNSTDTLRDIENVVGSRFADTITGNEQDNILVGFGGGDDLDGGAGTDTANYAASDAPVVVNLSMGYGAGGHAEGDSYESIENAVGSAFADTLMGSSAANKLQGGDQNDILHGLAGGDRLEGGAGSDTASYRWSTASVRIDLSTGLTTGNAGSHALGDVLVSIENLEGSEYFDILTGNGEANTLTGRGSTDWLAGLGGADHLDGGEGEDLADYRASPQGVTVDLTNNVGLGGDAQGDTYASIENVSASAYDDTLTGTAGDNQLDGFESDDLLAGMAGRDRIYGGEGSDTADYSQSQGVGFFDDDVTINLTTGEIRGGHAEGDTFISIENVIGSQASDTLTGDANANTLDGQNGGDVLAGLGGADTLIGGDDYMADTADYSASPVAVQVNLQTNVNHYGHAEGDLLFGIEDVVGTGGDDRITGNASDNWLYGLNGRDTLAGGDGMDTLMGGIGNDTLHGGLGWDVLAGQEDADTLVYASADESKYAGYDGGNGILTADRAYYFQSGIDKVDLRKVDANPFQSGDQAFVIVEEFTGAAGQLVITDPTDAGDGMEESWLFADLDGNGEAEFAIQFLGNVPQGTAAITPFDILL
jgi:Ca2+-binding RTX toxin-like protein